MYDRSFSTSSFEKEEITEEQYDEDSDASPTDLVPGFTLEETEVVEQDYEERQTPEEVEEVISHYRGSENGLSIFTSASMKEVELPDPEKLYDSPDEAVKIVHYLKYTSDSDDCVKTSAIRQIHSIIRNSEHPVAHIYPSVMETLNLSMQLFRRHSTILNREILSLMITLSNYANEDTLLLAITMLREKSQFENYDAVVWLIFRMGPKALKTMLDSLDSNSEWTNIILSHVVNNPGVVESVVVPALHKECHSFDVDKRTCAVRALKCLGVRVVSAVSTLAKMLIIGSVNRVLVGEAIRAMGEEGERVLLSLMHTCKDSLVREAIAKVFGKIPYAIHTPMRILANSDISTYSRSPTPRILYFYRGNNEQSVTPCLFFDSRELVLRLRKCILDGSLDKDFKNEHLINEELTDFFVKVHSLKPKPSKSNSTILNNSIMNLNISHTNAKNDTLSNTTSLTILKHHYAKNPVSEKAEQTMLRHVVSWECIQCLLSHLNHNDECVRVASAASIGNITDAANYGPIVDSLKASLLDPVNRVRAISLDALGKIGSTTDMQKQDLRSILKSMLPLLKDSHFNVRVAACRAFCNFSKHILTLFDRELYKSIFKQLLLVLKEGAIPRNDVAKCLSLLEHDGISRLILLLRSQTKNNTRIRIAAAHGLSLVDINSPFIDRTIECLFGCANDRMPLVRRAVLRALGVLANKSQEVNSYLSVRSLLPFLYEFLKDKEVCVRDMSAEVLALSGPYGELLLMEGLLKDKNPITRASSAHGMIKIGPKSIISLLLALNDPEPMVLSSVFKTIQSFKADAIIDTLKSRPNNQRETMVQTLKETSKNMAFNDSDLQTFSEEDLYGLHHVKELISEIIYELESITN